MRVKTGVVLYNMSFQINVLLRDGQTLDQAFQTFAGRDCIVTAGRNGRHRSGSAHYRGRAVDLRTNDIKRGRPGRTDYIQGLLTRLQLRLPSFHIILESAGLPNEHIHIEH